MTQPDPRWNKNERRNARIRELRDQRDSPMRRRRTFQPLTIVAWFAGVIALLGVLIFVGLIALSPRLFGWIEEHPGSIEQGLVRDFVQWYKPDSLADVPAGEDGRRITIEVVAGVNDSEIGQLLFDKGVITSRLAFENAVLQAGRSGDLQAGVYDLSPSLKPSEIVAALKQLAGPEVTIRLIEGWRLEQVVGYLGTTKLTMNLDEFAALAKNPPADLIAKYDFLADLPQGRSLEGYLYPDTYRVDANDTARQVIEKLLDTFGQRLTKKMRDQIKAEGLTIDQAVTAGEHRGARGGARQGAAAHRGGLPQPHQPSPCRDRRPAECRSDTAVRPGNGASSERRRSPRGRGSSGGRP